MAKLPPSALPRSISFHGTDGVGCWATIPWPHQVVLGLASSGRAALASSGGAGPSGSVHRTSSICKPGCLANSQGPASAAHSGSEVGCAIPPHPLGLPPIRGPLASSKDVPAAPPSAAGTARNPTQRTFRAAYSVWNLARLCPAPPLLAAQSCGNADKGREVLRAALASSPHIRQLWEAAVHFEEACGMDSLVERVLPLYQQAVAEQVREGCG